MLDACLFCGNVTIKKSHLGTKDAYIIDCPLCKSYIASATAVLDHIINQVPQSDRILFSGHLRNTYAEGKPPEILSDTLLKIPEIVLQYKKLTPIDKVNRLILYLGEYSQFIGYEVPLDINKDYTIFFCQNTVELGQLKAYLQETGIIKIEDRKVNPVLTIEGWKKFESLKEINHNSKKVFVAMCFDDDLKPIFNDFIVPACKECGFDAFRVDSSQYTEKICDKIIADIKAARFIIADFTKQKNGVYFEAGFAQGLGLKVIWTCKKNEAKDLNFDTRQYNHILWVDGEDLRAQLIYKIKAVIK